MEREQNHPVYSTEDYKLLANQIEYHERASDRLMKELEEKFPAGEGKFWVIMGDRRPYINVDNRIDTWGET